jgi:hypothetical protein
VLLPGLALKHDPPISTSYMSGIRGPSVSSLTGTNNPCAKLPHFSHITEEAGFLERWLKPAILISCPLAIFSGLHPSWINIK